MPSGHVSSIRLLPFISVLGLLLANLCALGHMPQDERCGGIPTSEGHAKAMWFVIWKRGELLMQISENSLLDSKLQSL